MRPAFSSTKQAAAFALLLLLLVALPVVVGKNLLPPREQSYSIQGWGLGPFPWIRSQIFEETNAIDIAFVGSSHVLNGIDTPYIQKKLSEKLGRQAVVCTIAWGGSGYDGLYLITHDLLEHRKVNTLVFYDEKVEQGDLGRNFALPSIFHWSEQASVLTGLPLPDQAIYYFISIVGMPRTLLSLLRSNIPAVMSSDNPGFIKSDNPESVKAAIYLGSVHNPQGFSPSFIEQHHVRFEPYVPKFPAQSNVYIYSSKKAGPFEFSHNPLPAWHLHFARKFASISTDRNCHLIILSIPIYDERKKNTIAERAFWPELLSVDVKMVGVPPINIFGEMTDQEIQKLYADPVHLNQNGQLYFTSIITPALVGLYQSW